MDRQEQVAEAGWVLSARKHLDQGDKAYYLAALDMQQAADEGWNVRDIAEQVGCSKSRVSNLLRALVQCTGQDDFGECYAAANNPAGGGGGEPSVPDPDDMLAKLGEDLVRFYFEQEARFRVLAMSLPRQVRDELERLLVQAREEDDG